MKYIRTEDGCILEKDNVLHNISKAYGVKDIKQADTIEELCDKFVMLDTNFGNIVVPDMEAIRFNLSKNGYVHQCSEIYGAIWTEWGLKYVAKMNEKGDLELL